MREHFITCGHEIIVDNYYALIFEFGTEQILFPKRNQTEDKVRIFICKDQKIVKKYTFKTGYLANLMKQLFIKLKERQYEQLHIYDKL